MVLIKQTGNDDEKNVIVSAITKSFIVTNNHRRRHSSVQRQPRDYSYSPGFQFLPNRVYLSAATNPRALISSGINFPNSAPLRAATQYAHVQAFPPPPPPPPTRSQRRTSRRRIARNAQIANITGAYERNGYGDAVNTTDSKSCKTVTTGDVYGNSVGRCR